MRLTTLLGDRSEILAIHMLHLMAVAARDLRRPNPASLYWRFAAWTLPSGTTCRLCGRHGHDVLPGAPPRLFPYADAHTREPARSVLRMVSGQR